MSCYLGKATNLVQFGPVLPTWDLFQDEGRNSVQARVQWEDQHL